MRAVATALVLIAGAAVILWYGSTLNNSWVLGGLIGGFAALLLSIPISLTLFSHLSHSHDERIRLEEQDEDAMQLARPYDYDYPAVPARRSYEVEADGYAIDEVDEEVYEDDDDAYWRDQQEWQEREEPRRRAPRRLPAPQPAMQRMEQRTGYTEQRQIRQITNGNNRENRLPAPRPQPQAYLPVPRQQIQQSSQPTQQGKTQRRNTKVLRSASLNSLSQHRMDALRAARREAAMQASEADIDDIEVSPTQYSKHTTRSRQNFENRYEQETYRRDEMRRMQGEPQTDYIDIDKQFPRTPPIRQTPQTEQVVRRVRTRDLDPNRQLSDRGDEGTDSIQINKPLVRRAPYMYDDDEMREQMLQQLEPPAVRRSSRQEVWQQDEDF